MENLFVAVAFAATLGSALMAGVFFAFSSFVMRALKASEGIVAMQAINIVVVNPVFLSVFLGTAGACVVTTVVAAMRWNERGSILMLAGSLLYVLGTFLVTVVGNVPLNNSLASVSPTASGAADQWARYVSRWSAWNHVRTLAALGATAALVASLWV